MSDNHDNMVRSWKENAEKDNEANFRFLRSLKVVRHPERIDAVAKRLHEEAFSSIDCTRCTHCCESMRAGFTDEDIDRIAAHLGVSRETFIASHLEFDALEDGYLMKAIPCPFLGGDGRCTIYEIRPKSCREFPHTDKKRFTSRISLHAENALSCPAAYHVVQGLRRRMGSR